MFDQILTDKEKFVIFVFLSQQSVGKTLEDLKKTFKINGIIHHLKEMMVMGAIFHEQEYPKDLWYITNIGMEFFKKAIEPKLLEKIKLQEELAKRPKSDARGSESQKTLESPLL